MVPIALIASLEELENNIAYFDKLAGGQDGKAARELIQRGLCFVVKKIGSKFFFYPSRFIGYRNNTLALHAQNEDKDGRVTNLAIRKIFKKDPLQSKSLEEAYGDYLGGHGALPGKQKRKYWLLNSEVDSVEKQEGKQMLASDDDSEFPEGKPLELLHLRRERNAKLIEKTKQEFKARHKKLFCQACGFDFESKYGDIGRDYIEAHHTLPVSVMEEGHVSRTKDMALVCSNCHRILHRRRPWLGMDELARIIEKNDK
ncbi:HNH endonuclease [Candidatus Falkowbacteria bacterium]|nr:HNH endonuclease [Candidatus Falkowbacteria bacterium]